jgi:hypothetical protein
MYFAAFPLTGKEVRLATIKTPSVTTNLIIDDLYAATTVKGSASMRLIFQLGAPLVHDGNTDMLILWDLRPSNRTSVKDTRPGTLFYHYPYRWK